jgi:predicted amidohydrolase
MSQDRVKVAAWQMPIAATAAADVLDALREQVRRCENAGVSMLCCPEAAIGGLADDAPEPAGIAIAAADVDAALAPLASKRVTLIVGFTELGRDGRLYNAAAAVRRGAVTGIYRKVHPAINRSVYAPGREFPVFDAGGLTFGIVICYDSTFAGPARAMALQGATVLFVPTNNALPAARKFVGLVEEARACDIARAVENTVWVVRADVAGRTTTHVCEGASGVVAPDGTVVCTANRFAEQLLIAEIDPRPSPRLPGATPISSVDDAEDGITFISAKLGSLRGESAFARRIFPRYGKTGRREEPSGT